MSVGLALKLPPSATTSQNTVTLPPTKRKLHPACSQLASCNLFSSLSTMRLPAVIQLAGRLKSFGCSFGCSSGSILGISTCRAVPSISDTSTTHGTSANSASSFSNLSSDEAQQQTWNESEYLQDDQAEQMQPSVDRQQVLREVLRRTHAAEAAMTHVLAGIQLGLCGRPDAAWFVQQEQAALDSVRRLLLRHHVRPSALLTVVQTAGLAAGAATALVSRTARDATVAALQEALTDLNNDNLRLLREAGLSEEAPEVRAVLLKLRNLERAAEGAVPPPDLLTLQQAFSQQSLASVGVIGILGAVVKAAADATIAATSKV